ncbi:MAG: hypothetical protein Q7T01_02940 [bacterium]|nr:hypothetical protein [bacterium]
MRTFVMMACLAVMAGGCGATQQGDQPAAAVQPESHKETPTQATAPLEDSKYPQITEIMRGVSPDQCDEVGIFGQLLRVFAKMPDEQLRRVQQECDVEQDGMVATAVPCIMTVAQAVADARRAPGGPCSATDQRAEAERLTTELREFPPPPEPMPEPMPTKLALELWTGYMLMDLEQSPPKMVALDTEHYITWAEALKNGVVLQPEPLPGGGWCFPVPGGVIFRSVCSSENGVWGTIVIDSGKDAGHAFNVRAHKVESMLDPCSRGVCGKFYKLVADDVVGCSGPRCREFWEHTNDSSSSLKQL